MQKKNVIPIESVRNLRCVSYPLGAEALIAPICSSVTFFLGPRGPQHNFFFKRLEKYSKPLEIHFIVGKSEKIIEIHPKTFKLEQF